MSEQSLTVLTGEETALAAAADSSAIGDLLKPLVREIHLFDTYAAGTSWLKDASVLTRIRPGDALRLEREANNRFDSNAILMLTESGEKIGYVPERDNLVFARLMDAGKLLRGRITEITVRGSYTQVSVGIYLVDF